MPHYTTGGSSNTSCLVGVGCSSSAATVLQVVALGEMNLALNAKNGLTFWRFRQERTTNFSLEAVATPFSSEVSFGGHAQVKLPRQGDLVHFMYIVFCLPGIYGCNAAPSEGCCGPCGQPAGIQYPCPAGGNYPNSGAYTDSQNNADCGTCGPCAKHDANVANSAWYLRNYGQLCANTVQECSTTELAASCEHWVHWAQAIGQLLIKKIQLFVGTHETDAMYSDFLFMWEELSGKAGLRLTEMIGKYNTRKALQRASRTDQVLYVPTPFWFTRVSGNALPLASLQFHAVEVRVHFESLENVIVRAHRNVQVRKTRDGSPLSASDLTAYLDVTYVYLDIHERNLFSSATFEQLITQVQSHAECQSGCRVVVNLGFNHPVIDLMWVVRRRCNEHANNWFNYSGIDGYDGITHVALHLNNLARFCGREGRYYRLVQPYQHYAAFPAYPIYAYSFALFPLEPQPSGSLNFSRIDNIQFIFDMQEGLSQEEFVIIIFARNFNILKYVDGVSGVAFNG